MALFQKKKTLELRDRAGRVPFLYPEMADRGVMPAMADSSGTPQRMKRACRDLAVSWTDFMTGPTREGTASLVYRPEARVLFPALPQLPDVKRETLWDTLGKMGKRSIILNQPSTYPARPLNGVLVSGFVALDLAKAVYPLSQKGVLDRLGYQVDIDSLKSRQDHAFFWSEIQKTTDGRERALDHFWKDDWDFFEFVVTGTDRLHHFLFNAYADVNHPDHGRFLDFYHRVDGIIGRIVSPTAA
jgi:predicted AlkP superfamily phosphohydrolase/phosphomutase